MGKQKKSAPEGFSNWRDYVKRIANTHGLAHECLLEFEWAISAGEIPEIAARRALEEWQIRYSDEEHNGHIQHQ